MNIGLYCNWKVKKRSDGTLYINSIHAKYLNVFEEQYDDIILLTNISEEGINSADVVVGEKVKIITLPKFNNYLGALKHFRVIIASIKNLTSKVDVVYVRTPEPFSWVFTFFKKDKIINYHFVSNPLEVLLKKKKSLKKYLTYILFLPEYYLTCIAAYFNFTSANGPSVLLNIPFFLRPKVRVLIENTLTDNELSQKKYLEKDIMGPIRLLCVSRLQEAKGLQEMVRAFYDLKHKMNREMYLTIAGEGPLHKELKELIVKLDLEQAVTMVGHVKNGSPLDELYRKSHILINPSLSETGPRVLLEAMAEGVVCISTDVGYVRYVYENENSLLQLIIAKDEKLTVSLNEIIDRVITSQKVYNDLSLTSFMLAKNYSLNDFVSKVIPARRG